MGADRELLTAFAAVLSYPAAPLAETVATCQELAAASSPEAAASLEPLRAFAESAGAGELQEAYTLAFDLDSLSELEPTCYPYVGHHLFDENHKRSTFLLGLAERYRTHGFAAPGELPDHLAVMLRFAGTCDDGELVDELLADAILPAVSGMAGRHAVSTPGSGRERYLAALQALHRVLQECGYESDVEPVTAHHQHSGWEH